MMDDSEAQSTNLGRGREGGDMQRREVGGERVGEREGRREGGRGREGREGERGREGEGERGEGGKRGRGEKGLIYTITAVLCTARYMVFVHVKHIFTMQKKRRRKGEGEERERERLCTCTCMWSM